MAESTDKKNTGQGKYPPEFRDQALRLAQRVGVPAAAEELGVSKSLLYRWRRNAKAEAEDSAEAQIRAAEIENLNALVARQAEEISILKKAAAYFARPRS